MAAEDTGAPSSAPSEAGRDMAAIDADLLARHAELVAIDNVIGLEARVAQLEFDLRRARSRIRRLQNKLEGRDSEIEALLGSRTWRLGRLFTGPISRFRR